jgi:hypothetical protein
MTREEDWEDADGGTWSALVKELEKELAPGHPLYEASYSMVARRWAQDDILLIVDGHPGCASLHLTWKQAPEALPWPRTHWHESVAAAKDSLDDS